MNMSIKNKIKSLFTVDEEYEYAKEPIATAIQQEEQRDNVVRLESYQSSSKVILIEPKDYETSQEIADHLKNRRAVVINLQRTSMQDRMRIVDFLSGCVYAIGGTMQKLSTQTFICAPDNIDISGSISEMAEE